MPIVLAPLAVYAAPIAGGVATGAVIAYFIKTSDGAISRATEEAANQALDKGAELIETTMDQLLPLLEQAGQKLGEAGLEFLRYAGPAVITGVENTYDAIRDLFRGKEDDIVAGFLTGFLALLTVVYLYQSVKVSGDAL